MHFKAIPTKVAQAFRAGAFDAHGNPPERIVSGGKGFPCRHCLNLIPEGAGALVLAYNPFEGRHPYAEVGPIFLCESECAPGDSEHAPAVLQTSPTYLAKGYSEKEWIVYGTGRIAPQNELEAEIDKIFAQPEVKFVHIRSATNNCMLMRVDREA